MSDKVYCSTCNKPHDSVETGGRTGYGCASVVAGQVLYGSYGSTVADMTRFQIVGPALTENALICDTCIERMIKQDCLVELSEEPLKKHDHRRDLSLNDEAWMAIDQTLQAMAV